MQGKSNRPSHPNELDQLMAARAAKFEANGTSHRNRRFRFEGGHRKVVSFSSLSALAFIAALQSMNLIDNTPEALAEADRIYQHADAPFDYYLNEA